MDLFAYAQIEDLESVARDNGIEVPRLRGYRLMASESEISEADLQKMMAYAEIEACEGLCRAEPFWDPNSTCYRYSDYSDYLLGYFLEKAPKKHGEYHTEYTAIRWDRIHGKKRRILKFEIKKRKRRIRAQYDMWNKYAGVPNVLYIHARIGGRNWIHYNGDELRKQQWFLEKVDDSFDGTYCDIYAKLKN